MAGQRGRSVGTAARAGQQVGLPGCKYPAVAARREGEGQSTAFLGWPEPRRAERRAEGTGSPNSSQAVWRLRRRRRRSLYVAAAHVLMLPLLHCARCLLCSVQLDIGLAGWFS